MDGPSSSWAQLSQAFQLSPGEWGFVVAKNRIHTWRQAVLIPRLRWEIYKIICTMVHDTCYFLCQRDVIEHSFSQLKALIILMICSNMSMNYKGLSQHLEAGKLLILWTEFLMV